jgi:hypothetical protein
MDGVKGFLNSKTIWGGIIAALGAAASLFGLDFGAADQAATLEAVYNIISAAGALLAIIGRVQATKTIGQK